MSPEDQFRDAIQAAGLTPPDEIEPGRLHRFSSNGKRADDAGWCKLFPDLAGGVFGDHRTGLSETWQAERAQPYTAAEREAFRLRCESDRREREAETARRQAAAATAAAAIWRAAKPAGADHPYLVRKGVKPVPTLRELPAEALASVLGYVPRSKGEPLAGRVLVAPVKVGGKASTAELIDETGRKSAVAGGRKTGGFWAAQALPAAVEVLLIGEGVATVLSAAEATGNPVVAALSSSNLPAVARTMRERFPAARLILLADLVKSSGEPDPHATEAARAVGALLAVPDFGPDRLEGETDVNDLHQARGLEAVRECIASAAHWPEPQPLAAKIAPEPYPLDALPPTLRAAVQEVAAFVKAPVPLVAASALAALSVAAQAHIDVRRADKLQGPAGTYHLTIADSGERKSTVDGFFVSEIRRYESEQAEAMKPELARYVADVDAWTAEWDGILSAIKEASKKGKPTDMLRADLATLQTAKPAPPMVPRLLLGDETPEALAWSLATKWPSAGVITAEAGLILGAHGMGKDSALRNLALLNVLWDGGTHSVGRRTSDCFTVRGARLTVGLQIQEAALRSFFERSGTLARGTGFLARFLVAWPESTQGFRPFTEAPSNWPHLAAFHRRITEILADPVQMDEDGALSPVLLSLTPDAKAAWISFHDAIERELASGGELFRRARRGEQDRRQRGPLGRPVPGCSSTARAAPSRLAAIEGCEPACSLAPERSAALLR